MLIKLRHKRHIIATAFGLALCSITFAQAPEQSDHVSEKLSKTTDPVITEKTFPPIRNAVIREEAEEATKPPGTIDPSPEYVPSERLVTNAKRQNQTYVRPDSKTRFKRYTNSIIGPASLAGNVVSAGFSTITNSPEEWEKNTRGFGKRLASGFASGVIKKTTMYGLDEALKFDSHFYKSKDRSTGAKIKNALISPVTAYDKNGKRVVGVPRIIGTYTAAVISRETWYPARYDYKDGLKSGTISLGVNAAFNLVREFFF